VASVAAKLCGQALHLTHCLCCCGHGGCFALAPDQGFGTDGFVALGFGFDAGPDSMAISRICILDNALGEGDLAPDSSSCHRATTLRRNTAL